jgi:D-alanyl-D-alanine carboxypeptidase
VRRTDGKLYVGHGGGYSGYTTNTTIQLDSKVAVIVLTNTNDPNSRHIAGQLMSTVGEAVAKAAAPKMDNKLNGSQIGNALLDVITSEVARQVLMMNEKLVIMSSYSTNIGNPIELEPLSGDLFKMKAPTGGAFVGEVVRFIEQNGVVMRMIIGDTYFDHLLD